MTSSEVIEPLSIGLEFEVLIDRAGFLLQTPSSLHCSGFAESKGSPAAGRTKKPKDKNTRPRAHRQTVGWIPPMQFQRLTSIKKKIREGWTHDPCWNCMNVVYQYAIYWCPSFSLIFTFSHSFYPSIYPSIFDLLSTNCIQSKLHKRIWLFLVKLEPGGPLGMILLIWGWGWRDNLLVPCPVYCAGTRPGSIWSSRISTQHRLVVYSSI